MQQTVSERLSTRTNKNAF